MKKKKRIEGRRREEREKKINKTCSSNMSYRGKEKRERKEERKKR
jgi:hypothetical protein